MTEDDIIGEITEVVTFAKGTGVHIRQYLNQQYGRGHWRKRKGIAYVQDDNGNLVWLKYTGLKHTVSAGGISSVSNGWKINDELRAMHL